MLKFPEKLPNAECYVYLKKDDVYLTMSSEYPRPDKKIFNFHELAMLWYWNDEQIKKYFSTRSVIEEIVK